MRERKKLAGALSLKATEGGGGFSGYGSMFNVVDSQNDRVMPGAFRSTLKKQGGKVKLLWQHRMEEPIGRFIELREDGHGLFVAGQLLLEVQRGQEAYTLLKARALEGLSIGYTPTKYDFEPATGVRRIHELTLWEVSLVTFPANSEASVTGVKSLAAPGSEMLRLAESLERATAILRG